MHYGVVKAYIRYSIAVLRSNNYRIPDIICGNINYLPVRVNDFRGKWAGQSRLDWNCEERTGRAIVQMYSLCHQGTSLGNGPDDGTEKAVGPGINQSRRRLCCVVMILGRAGLPFITSGDGNPPDLGNHRRSPALSGPMLFQESLSMKHSLDQLEMKTQR